MDSGRIDKRLISELGFGNDRVFSNSFVDTQIFPSHLSDPMVVWVGKKWENTMKSVVLTNQIDMINNVDVVSSFYQTSNSGRTVEVIPPNQLS